MLRTETTILLSTAIALLAVVAAGCAGDCTGDDKVTMLVSVVDSSGTTVSDQDLNVQWSNAGEEDWVDCERSRSTPDPHVWNCADRENPGRFDVRASLNEQSGQSTNIRVRDGDCHVQTRNIEVLIQ